MRSLVRAVALLLVCCFFRAAAYADAPDPPPRLPRRYLVGPIAGITLTVLAGALSIGGIATALAPSHCTDPENWCGIGRIGIAAGLGAGSALAAVIGVPLLVVSERDRQRAKRELFVIDSVGPRALPSGGGFGVTGRF
jgi:hypothetical protein